MGCGSEVRQGRDERVEEKRRDTVRKRLASSLATALVVVIMTAGGTAPGRAQQPSTQPEKEEPIHITSDRVEALQQQRQVIFIGHVVATQKDTNISGDKMTVFYAERRPGEKQSADLGGPVDHIVMEGNVRITQGDRVATSDVATFYRGENKVILTGHPRAIKNQDVITGDRIIYFLDSGKSIVESGPSGRVQATLHSGGLKDAPDGSKGEGKGSSTAAGDSGG
jgi:lipopolysaccharide export system protein LptA